MYENYNDYDDMVVEAFEEISGMDKMARNINRIHNLESHYENNTGAKKLVDAMAERHAARYDASAAKAKMKAAKRAHGAESDEYRSARDEKREARRRGRKAMRTQFNPVNHMRDYLGRLSAAPGANFGWMPSVLDDVMVRNKAYAKAIAKKTEKQASAYYEAAQFAKEAAEADYAEACAYEEAALDILDELGYLD